MVTIIPLIRLIDLSLSSTIIPWRNYIGMKEIQRLCKHEIGIIDDDLEELINTIYTNKMHLLFDRYMK